MPGLQTVYQLQIADLERADAARKLQEAEKALGETVELRQARLAVEEAKARLAQLRTRVRDLELEFNSLTGKIAATEERLYGGDVRNPKELENLRAELHHLRDRRETLEDNLLTDLTTIDDVETHRQQVQARWKAVQSAWQEQQTRLEAVLSDLRAQLARLDERIARLRAALPASLLQEYDDTCRKKGGRGIAAIRSGLCEGCRVSVPTSLIQQVRRSDEAKHCDSCGRILCVVE